MFPLESFSIFAALLMVSVVDAQEPKTVQVAGIVGGSNLTVKAVRDGEKLTGNGTLTAANGAVYDLAVKMGSVRGKEARLQGTIGPRGGDASVTFTLSGNSATGAIEFSYIGGSGRLITQTAKGTVVFE